MLKHKRIKEILMSSLLGSKNLNEAQNNKDGIRVNGITSDFYFSISKLKEFENEITAMINELDPRFKEGLSFLNMCIDKNGELWTGEHVACEELLVLGLAIGKMEYCMSDKKYWVIMGGVPYVRVVG